MTIEDKCNDLIQKWNNKTYHKYLPKIEDWVFRKPRKEKKHNSNVVVQVMNLIKKADGAECLTSSCKYIRECKKWQLRKK